jgi:hypothetical protein
VRISNLAWRNDDSDDGDDNADGDDAGGVKKTVTSLLMVMETITLKICKEDLMTYFQPTTWSRVLS